MEEKCSENPVINEEKIFRDCNLLFNFISEIFSFVLHHLITKFCTAIIFYQMPITKKKKTFFMCCVCIS